MAGKPIDQRQDQSAAGLHIALGQQRLNFMHRLQHRGMLVNVAVAWREGRVPHPLVLFIEMLLQMGFHGLKQVRQLRIAGCLQLTGQVDEFFMECVHGGMA